MLYDRPYMRQSYGPQPRGGPGGGQRSVVTMLLIVTIAVFVAQQMLNVMFPGLGGRDNLFMNRWFALSGANFQDLKVWTVLSYAFLHSTHSFMHIFGNMLGLFFVGRILEPVLGKRQFLNLYFGGAIIGGLIYLAFHYQSAQAVVGASAAVFAIFTFFCLLRPDQPITLLLFFIIPVTLKPRYIFWGALGISALGVLFFELPGKSMMAHSAHLGGVLAGILYFRFVYNGQLFFLPERANQRPAVEPPEWVKRKKAVQKEISYEVNRTNRDEIQKEVDRILDKINESGFGSLSADEKTTLDRARDILSR